jgi:S-adenosylmethionine-diacylglycerol 3-amino-3-carboxypropyl transferase
MSAEQMTALWTQIDRTAHDKDARVIFRTAGSDSPLPKKIPSSLLEAWDYSEAEARRSMPKTARRSMAVFHVYKRRKST